MTGKDGSHPDAVRLTAACRAATTPEEPEDAGRRAGKEDFNQMTQNDLDDIISRLRDSIQTGGTPVPPGYDFETALKAVRRQLSEDRGDGPDWQSGSATSLANALYDMVTLGLSLEDKSCYLFRKSRTSPQYVLRRSYYGTQKVVRELYPDCRIFAAAVYDGEQFSLGKFVNGRPEAIIHFPDLACINNGRIVASYAVITDRDDKVIGYGILNAAAIETIRSGRGGRNEVWNSYPEEMAKKSAINRACKSLVNAIPSNLRTRHGDMMISSFNRTNDYVDDIDSESPVAPVQTPAMTVGAVEEPSSPAPVQAPTPAVRQVPEPQAHPDAGTADDGAAAEGLNPVISAIFSKPKSEPAEAAPAQEAPAQPANTPDAQPDEAYAQRYSIGSRFPDDDFPF